MNPTAQRIVGIGLLLVVGAFSLPVSAYFFDGQGTENLIVPIQLVMMAAIGAGVALLFPALARPGAGTASRALGGVSLGLLAAILGVVVFWFLLNGLGGA